MLENTPLTLALPKDAVQRIRRMAFDLAWGAVNELWHPRFFILNSALEKTFVFYQEPGVLVQYVREVWQGEDYKLRLM